MNIFVRYIALDFFHYLFSFETDSATVSEALDDCLSFDLRAALASVTFLLLGSRGICGILLFEN